MKLIIGLALIFLISSVLGYEHKRMRECPYVRIYEELRVCYDSYTTFIRGRERNPHPNKTLTLELFEATENAITPYAFNNSHIRTMVIEPYRSTMNGGFTSIPQLSLWRDSFAGMQELEELGLYHFIVNFNNENPFARLGLLKVLALRGFTLSEMPHEMLDSLPKLEKLDLKENRIYTIRPDLFASLKNLKTLDLSDNNITHIEPGAFNGLSELKELTLNHNNFDLEAGMFQGMPKLNILKLNWALSHDDNILKDGLFDDLSELTELYLSHNILKYISTEAFQKLGSLKRLDLSHNLIRAIPMNVFRNLTSLRDINLGNNYLGSLTRLFRIFSGLVLDTLILSANDIYMINPDSLESLRLRNLDINGNIFGDIEASEIFNGLTAETLYLGRKGLSQIDADYFNGFQISTISKGTDVEAGAFNGFKVKKLDLSSNHLIEIDANDFDKLHSEILVLKQNNIETTAENALKDAVTERLSLVVNPIHTIDSAEGDLPDSVKLVFHPYYLESSKDDEYE